jgi:membrane-associated protease RseP (regulator of RpoE activity)
MLATAAALSFQLISYVPSGAALWVAQNLKNALVINIVLAVFNMLPLPPLDGGRIVTGLLPNFLAAPFARLEPYGLRRVREVLANRHHRAARVRTRAFHGPAKGRFGAHDACAPE